MLNGPLSLSLSYQLWDRWPQQYLLAATGTHLGRDVIHLPQTHNDKHHHQTWTPRGNGSPPYWKSKKYTSIYRRLRAKLQYSPSALQQSCIKPSMPGPSYQIRKTTGSACAGNAGTFSPPPRASDPDMHRGRCVTHVLWCMPGSLTSGFLWSWWRGKRPRHFQRMRNPQILRIW